MRRILALLALLTLLSLSLVLVACAPRSTVSSAPDTARSTTTSATAGGANLKTIYLAGGCFWGLEKYVALVQGVANAEVGYANGDRDNARYGDGSGYAEVVKIEYDPAVAPLDFILGLYYDAIDPVSVNRQGNDVGTEYRTGIYYTDPADKAVIQASIAKLQKGFSEPIAIEVKPLVRYTAAEEYHQDYLAKNPGGYCHIPRKLFDAAAKARPE
jgi:peptide methionine sulfoxide reductase msrA/msrB